MDSSHSLKVRNIARLIGFLVSSLPAVKYGTLNYRYLEIDKINALKCSKGNVVVHMVISEKGVSEMQWWLCNLDGSFNPIRYPQVDVTLYSDAYLAEWRAVMNDISTGRRLSVTEANSHINCFELLAVLFALRCFHASLSGKHVQLMIENTTAVAAINNMETCHTPECHSLAVQIWEFSISHEITWLIAAHIPSSLNVRADRESRHFHSEDTEWMINPTLLRNALDTPDVKPEIELFASRLNRQFPIYCSFRRDPEASCIDAFTISWTEKKILFFSTF